MHKAVTNVLRLLAREMKPLGMEGVATFDPLSGLFLWREHRRFAAARKRAVRELYREDVDDEFGARGRGRDEEDAEAETKATKADAWRRTTRKPPKTTTDATTHPEKLREKSFVSETLPLLKLGARHAAAAYGSLAALLENNSARDRRTAWWARYATPSSPAATATPPRRSHRGGGSVGRVAVADIVAADWVTLPFSPASYVAVDREGATVVLAIRGTVSTGDLLTDAVSTSTPFLGGWAHSGMVMSAYQVCKTQLPAAAAALVNNPGYAFLVTGHSMGAGVAAILAMLVHSGDADVLAAAEKAAKEAAAKRTREKKAKSSTKSSADERRGDDGETPPEESNAADRAADHAMAAVRDVKCHCFAAPSVCSLDLSLAARAHTVSVVAGKDVIPRLCYAAVRRLLRRLNAAAPSQPVMKAISMALGGRDKKSMSKDNAAGASARLFGEEPIEDERALSSSAEDVFGAKKPPSRASAPDAARVAEPEPEPEPESRARVRESRCQGEWDDVAGERGLELRDHYASDFLVQPGFVIHLRHLTSDEGPTAEARHPTAFTEIPISTRMMADHVPMVYQSAIEAVAARAELEARGGGGREGVRGGGEAVRTRGPSRVREGTRGAGSRARDARGAEAKAEKAKAEGRSGDAERAGARGSGGFVLRVHSRGDPRGWTAGFRGFGTGNARLDLPGRAPVGERAPRRGGVVGAFGAWRVGTVERGCVGRSVGCVGRRVIQRRLPG